MKEQQVSILLRAAIFGFALGVVAKDLSAVEIIKQKQFRESETPTFQTTTLSVTLDEKLTSSIERKFMKLHDIAKKSNICVGGQYNIRPRYKYKKNRDKEFIAYNGYISFKCTFKDNNKYEKVLDKFQKIEDIKISQNKIKFKLSEDETDLLTAKLEEQAYLYAKKYTKSLEKFYNKCTTKQIILRATKRDYRPYLKLNKALNSKSTVTSPIIKDNKKDMHLNVKYIFNCDEKE